MSIPDPLPTDAEYFTFVHRFSRQWILVTMQQLVDHWRLNMLYALGTKLNETELRTFEPGQARKLEEKIPCGIL
jgi:hypothetical protein